MPCKCVSNFLTFERSQDERLLTYYISYHIGRLILMSGSIILLAGLFLRFLFYEAKEGAIYIFTLFISFFGIALFCGGMFALIYSVCLSQNAQKRALEESQVNRLPNPNYDGSFSASYQTSEKRQSGDSTKSKY